MVLGSKLMEEEVRVKVRMGVMVNVEGKVQA